MEKKFAVALLKGDEEIILGLFGTKEEADTFGHTNCISHSEGLQYCFSSYFIGNRQVGADISIYDYYNLPQYA